MASEGILEIACFSAEHAVTAWRAGADRVELCAEQNVGGTTPSPETILRTKKAIDIPINVMIRPRGGTFYYSPEEFENMKADLVRFKPDSDGFVFGVLTEARTVDIQKTAELVRLAHPLPCTFHRAIDETPDLPEALEAIMSTGCRAVLTSGGAPDAASGASMIDQLIREANGRITIIPGGGVRASNLSKLKRKTRATVFHSSGQRKGGSAPEPDELLQMRKLLQGDDSLENS